MITVQNLTKTYGEQTVLNIDQLEIPKGQSFGLVGNNGAGKTTLFSLLLDLIQPSSGHVINNGVQVDQSEAWKPFTSAFIDETFLIGYLTPEEYFYFIGELRGRNKADVDALLSNFDDFFHDEILGQKKYLRDLSKGNQKKVGIVASFIGNPEVVILDENGTFTVDRSNMSITLDSETLDVTSFNGNSVRIEGSEIDTFEGVTESEDFEIRVTKV